MWSQTVGLDSNFHFHSKCKVRWYKYSIFWLPEKFLVMLAMLHFKINFESGFFFFFFFPILQTCPSILNPMDCSMPGFHVLHHLPEFFQTHVHRVGDTIQSSHPLLSPFPPALDLFQHQGLFQWVSSSHQVAQVLKFQLQHQSFQWVYRTDFL